MKRKRTTRTTLEEHELVIVRSSRQRATFPRCPVCPQQVALITLAEAVMLAGVNSRVIHQWIESRSVHFAETPDGMALVCPASLVEQTRDLRLVTVR
jgi:hypothetical protein